MSILCNHSPELPMTVQYHESDDDFLRRILAKEGVFLNLHQDGTKTKVQLCDALDQLSEYQNGLTQRYLPNAGTAKNETHVSAVIRNSRHSPSLISLTNYQPWEMDSGDCATVDNPAQMKACRPRTKQRASTTGIRAAEQYPVDGEYERISE